MKLILQEKREKELTILVEYPQLDAQVKRIVHAIRAEEDSVMGEEGGRSYCIPIADIFYAECIDKRTFIYTQSHVYRVSKSLSQLEENLRKYSFARVSKRCLLNVNVLEGLKTLPNSKLEANLVNGEKIIISRTYIPEIKKVIFAEV